MTTVPRRKVLQGLAAAAGAGAAGVLAGARPAAAAPGTTLELRVTGLRSSVDGPTRTAGQQAVLSGTLHDAAGTVLGVLTAVSTSVHATGSPLDLPGTASVETQTLHLPDGTLVGQGSAAHDGAGEFAVVGGTGRYAAARGSYTQTRDLHRFGGGTAHLTLSLLLQEPDRGV